MLILLVVLSLKALGAETAEKHEHTEAIDTGAEFQIDKDLMKQLYQESVIGAEVDTNPISSGILITTHANLFNPQAMSLSNDYFEVPYTSQIGTVPSVKFSASGMVSYFWGLEVYLVGEVGYSLKEGTYNVINKKAVSDPNRIGTVRFHWLPFSFGPKLQYQFGSFTAIKPFVKASAGAQWFYQQGTLDGLEQGFWVPFYEYGAGLTLLEQTQERGDWFGGVSVGASQRESFGSTQTVRGWSFDVGVNILL